MIGAVALVVVSAYVGVKFSASRATPAATTVVAVQSAPVAVPVAVKAAEPVASATQPAVTQGVAVIETVPPAPVPASAAAAGSTPSVTNSLNNIQLALDRSEPAAPSKREAVSGKEVVKYRGLTPAIPATERPAARAGTAPDTDAELLAAMLPHLKRSVLAPTSPAYEKRCGQLTGEAAVDCRAKFCNGRQGVDAACPAAVQH